MREPSGVVTRAGGRRLAYDDAGDPSGAAVVYLHGCPDCRLTRHPDDGVAARGGVRLIALDRPGYGSSDPDPSGDDNTLAADVVAIADALGIARFGVFGWSSGAAGALALAVRHPDRVAVVGVAAGLVPIEADDDPDVLAALDSVIASRTDVLHEMTADDFASAVAPLVAVPTMSLDLAREQIVEGKDADYRRDLDAVDGLHDQLAVALVEAVRHGLNGVEHDMRAMVSPWPFDLAAITVPVLLWYGTRDVMFGPAAGRWLADRIPTAQLEVLEASHLLPLVRWGDILTTLAFHLDPKEANAAQS
jgi:pimeloyl-ACP methyl ester carboxylesterase